MRRKRDNQKDTIFGEEFTHPEQDWDETDPKEVYGRVANSTYVNVRKEPSRDSDVVATLMRAAPVKILEELDQFYKIDLRKNRDTKAETGYISKDFCEVI